MGQTSHITAVREVAHEACVSYEIAEVAVANAGQYGLTALQLAKSAHLYDWSIHKVIEAAARGELRVPDDEE